MSTPQSLTVKSSTGAKMEWPNASQKHKAATLETDSPDVRLEKDTFGVLAVPSESLWGAQTQRTLRNFSVGDCHRDRMPLDVIHSLALIKAAAATANMALSGLAADKGRAIIQAAEEIARGEHDDDFPLTIWQSGSGTQSNMNVNEVIANRASEIMKPGSRGYETRLVHPNDDVNKSQSTNDVFPSAIHVAAAMLIVSRVIPALDELRRALMEKSAAFSGIVKCGRTHLQDATPVTLGQEFGGYAAQLKICRDCIEGALQGLFRLAIGGTAVGTGLNAHACFGSRVAAELATRTGIPFYSATDRFAALGGLEGPCFAHAALKTLASSLMKIASDIRLMGSGPRSGFGELQLPANEPGSSIMPGKVNPTQCEAVIMAATQVIGNDTIMGIASSSGILELNVFQPLVARTLTQSCDILADIMTSFSRNCVVGIQANEKKIKSNLESSLMLVTALSPIIGYDRAAAIAQKAHTDGSTLRKAALQFGIKEEQFDKIVQPCQMI